MRDQCIRAVNSALTKKGYDTLTQVQERGIEQRVAEAMNVEARKDPAAWRAMSDAQRLQEAGARAADGVIAEAAKKTQRIGLTILARDRIDNYNNAAVANGSAKNVPEAMLRQLVHDYDEKSGNIVPVESDANARFDQDVAQLSDVIKAMHPALWKRVLKLAPDLETLNRMLTEAAYGKKTGNAEIDRAGQLYRQIADERRKEFNANGGVIGKLEGYGQPQSWSSRLAWQYDGYGADWRKLELLKRLPGKATEAAALHQQMVDSARDAFADKMTRWSDPRQYVKDDGTLYTPAERKAFFQEAWKTIVTDGLNKEDSGADYPGGSVKANRGAHHREIHLLPDHAYEALKTYGNSRGLPAMLSGLRRMNRDIALVKWAGPNPDLMVKDVMAKAARDAANSMDPSQAKKSAQMASYATRVYDHIAGNEGVPVNENVANTFQTMRSLQVAAKGGKFAIASLTHAAPLYWTALHDRINPLKVLLNSTLIWSPKSRRYVRRMGLAIDSMIGHSQQFAADGLTAHGLSGKVATAVVDAQWFNHILDARRMGWSMTMLDAIGHLTRQYQDFATLKANDHSILSLKNIDQKTWDIWRAAKLDSWGANHTMLTPENIMAAPGFTPEAKRDAVIRLMSMVKDEETLAVPHTGGAREKTQLQFGSKKGTIEGELIRSMILFKSFPWTFMTRHWQRAEAMGGPFGLGKGTNYGRFGYMAGLMVFMTALGAVRNWVNDLEAGRDPREMNPLTPDPHANSIAIRNWIAAGLSGGGVGVFGDFVFGEQGQGTGQTALDAMAGPVFGTAVQLGQLTTGAAAEAASGRDPHWATRAIRFARSNMPFMNLHYTQALLDRAVWNQLGEMTDPGYTERMREMADQQGSAYWWDPADQPLAGQGPERVPQTH